MWVVVEMDDTGLVGAAVNTYGPYADKDEAERARRRTHLDNRLAPGVSEWTRLPKTYVSEVREP